MPRSSRLSIKRIEQRSCRAPAVRRVVVKFRDEVDLPYQDHLERVPPAVRWS